MYNLPVIIFLNQMFERLFFGGNIKNMGDNLLQHFKSQNGRYLKRVSKGVNYASS